MQSKLLVVLQLCFLFSLVTLLTVKTYPSDGTCQWTDPNQHVYNFHQIMRQNNNYHFTDTDGTLYTLNVCQDTVTDSKCSCCTPNTATGYSMKDKKCTPWGQISNGVTYNYIDPDDTSVGVSLTTTYTNSGHQNGSQIYHLFCNENAEFGVMSVYQIATNPPHIEINCATKYACKNVPSPTPTPHIDPTICKTIYNDQLYDLEPLKKQYHVQDSVSGLTYFLGVCTNVTTRYCPCCDPDLAVGWAMDQNGVCEILGDLNNNLWQAIDNYSDPYAGISLRYMHKGGGQRARLLRFDFICEESENPGHITEIDEDASSIPVTVVTYPTKWGCPVNPWSPLPTPTPKPCPSNNCPTVSPKSNNSTQTITSGYAFLVVIIICIATFALGIFVRGYRHRNK
ncbi:lysosomal enzyme receptor protein isoform e [Anaeramoeba flamelloides]|uniref:Lysosomal enzyme receptor protein isoform e n=1 Tax=Anaeramoeba flamelloides TaxID=1746091 RepID=A0AAV7YFH5_9EUKA|nr:lysosomal enzyme receptor protein isoform e [Anaeramoeba flamelloides]